MSAFGGKADIAWTCADVRSRYDGVRHDEQLLELKTKKEATAAS